jgi:hypothetical protein
MTYFGSLILRFTAAVIAALVFGVSPLAAQELLANNSFESPVTPVDGNNFYTTIPAWTVENVAPAQTQPFNVVRPWSGYAGNPTAPPIGGGLQYFDVNSASGNIRQTVNVPANGMLDFSGWFSIRDNQRALSGMTINILNASGTIIATASTSFLASDPIGLWKQVSGSNVEVTAGTYIFEVVIPDPVNFDLASLIFDAAPVITSAASFDVNEGEAGVATLTADEPVTWAITGGADAGDLSIDPGTGVLTFNAVPDFETPADDNGDNVYVIEIEASDAPGNFTRILVSVTVLNHPELQQRLDEVTGPLRGGLRTHALVGLSDLLSYNEDVMLGDTSCLSKQQKTSVSGSVNANEISQNADTRFENTVTDCDSNLQISLDFGASFSNLSGNSRARGFASVRLEKKISDDIQLGINAIVSTASDTIDGFSDSEVSDYGGTLTLYGRARIDRDLVAGAFVGVGRSSYNFGLRDNGLDIKGKFTGNRFIIGGLLRGNVDLGDLPLTVDMVFSHATENLRHAKLDATFEDESAKDVLVDLGRINRNRISIPLTYSVFGSLNPIANSVGMDATAGVLCEDDMYGSGFDCGYQGGVRLWRRAYSGNYAYIDVDIERAASVDRISFDVGYTFDVGLGDNFGLGISAGTNQSNAQAADYSGLISIIARR